MGHFINKANSGKDTRHGKSSSNSSVKNGLYKPIKEFKWQDATKKEIREESIKHYSTLLSV